MVTVAQVIASIDARPASKGAAEYKTATDKMAEANRRAGRTTDQARDKLGRFTKQTQLATFSIKGLVAGFAAMAAARSAVRTIAEFEFTMRTVQGVTNATADQFERLSATARELGATTRFSAKEAGEGLLFLARAGFTVSEAIAAVPATLNLAAAGALSLGEAADFASNIVSQFGLTAAETVRVANTLVTVSNSSNTNVRQLAEAMKFAGTFAAALGNTVETTASAIGVLGDRGIQASQAGTNLRGILAALTERSDKLDKVLSDLKLTFDDVNPEKNNLIEIFSRFSESQLSAAQSTEIFGRRNTAAALTIQDSVVRMRELEDAAQKNTDAAQEMADTMDDSLVGSMLALKSAVQEAALATGDTGLAGAFRKVVDTVTGTVRILAGMGGTLDEVTFGMRALVNVVEFFIARMAVLAALKIGRLFFGIARAVKAVVTGMGALNVALRASPWGLIASGVALVASSLIDFVPKAQDATRESTKFAESLELIKKNTETLPTIEVRLRRSRGLKSVGEEVSALQQKINAFRTAAVELQVKLETEDIATIPRGEFLRRFGIPDEGFTIPVVYDQKFDTDPATRDFFESATKQAPGLLNTSEAIGALEAAIKKLNTELADAQKRLNQRATDRATTDAANKEKEAFEKTAAAIRKNVEALKIERKLIGESATTKKVLEAQEAAIQKALKNGIKDRETAKKLLADELALLEKQIRSNAELERGAEGAARSRARSIAAGRERSKQRDAFNSLVGETIIGLENEIKVLSADEDQRKALQIAIDLENAARRAGTEFTKEQKAEVLQLAQAIFSLRSEQDAQAKAAREAQQAEEEAARIRDTAIAQVTELQSRLKLEKELVGLSNKQKAIEVQVREFNAAAIAAEKENVDQLTEAYRKNLEELEKSKELEQLGRNIGNSFGNALEDIVFGAKSAKEALNSLLQDVGRAVFRQLVTQNIATGIGDLFGSAKGNVFMGGDVVPFARGGVVNSPTFFPMNGNKTGLMGEAGPEAILPLKRGSDGSLGVQGGGGTQISIDVGGVNLAGGGFNALPANEKARVIAEHVRRALERDPGLRRASKGANGRTL